MTDRKRAKIGALVALAAAMAIVAALVPRFAQDPEYHAFADQRVLLAIPHFGDVVSNLAYLIVAVLGLRVLLDSRGRAALAGRFERWPALVFFIGVVLVAAGSTFYHWDPTTPRLYWDRLPITVAFTALLALFIADRVHARLGATVVLPALVALGAACVTYWQMSERAGAGDLRFYFLVQAYVMVLTPLVVLLFPGRLTSGRHVVLVAAWYGAALVCEQLDHEIFALLGGAVSGHTVKHVLSAVAITMVAAMLRQGLDRAGPHSAARARCASFSQPSLSA